MKRFTFLSALVLLPMLYLNAQELKVFEEWATSTGTQNMFLEIFTETNASGGVYIGGATINSNGDYDILLTRYGRRGNLLWTVQYAGAGDGDDAAAAMCLGDSGNVYVTGTVYSSSSNQNDCVVLKYDAYGNLKWVRTFNGNANGPDYGTDICIDANNNVYIGGAATRTSTYYDFLVLKYDRGGNSQWVNYYDNLNLFDIANNIEINGSAIFVAGGTQVNASNYEYAVAEFNATNGNFNAVKTSSSTGTGIDQIHDLCLDDNGNIYVTGGVVNANNHYDYKTIKLDDSLNVEWTAIYDGADNLDDIGQSIQVDASGNVYVTGFSVTLDEDTNMVTLKYDSTGTATWTEEYNNDHDLCDKGKTLIVDDSGNIYVSGTTHNGSNTDYLTLKYNSSGDLQWEISYNGPSNENDQAQDICIDDDGYIYVVGQCEDNGGFKYYTVMYTEIEVIDPPDVESTSNAISYIENVGQLLNTNQNPASDVKFYSTGTSPSVYFEDENISFVLSEIISQSDSCGVGDTIHYHRCEMEFHEADPDIVVRAFDPNNDYFNYYLAHIPKGRERVQHYDRVIYSNLFDDIDLQFSNNNRGYKFYYIIKPGADPADIEFAFSGTDSMFINASGNLVLATSLGEMVFPEGEAYQINSSGNKVMLAWQPEFVLNNSTVNFSTGTYDSSKPLVFEIKQGNSTSGVSSIDNLEWCTYYGGISDEMFLNVESNNANSIWVTGFATGEGFPTHNSSSMDTLGDYDIVLLRFKNTGVKLWASYFGGEANDGYLEWTFGKAGIAVDSGDSCYISYSTQSKNLPVKKPGNAYCDSVCSCTDIFISQFDDFGELSWSTYFGGGPCVPGQMSHEIKLDNIGNLYVTGIDIGIPLQDPLPYSGAKNTFIAKFDPGHELAWSTYYGGSQMDYINSIAFDSANNMVITGHTSSHDFPYTQYGNAYCEDDYHGGAHDAFVAKFENDSVVWATYLGGNGDDYGNAVYIDPDNNYYIVGATSSSNYFPVINSGSPSYYDSTYNGSSGINWNCYKGDGFIAKFNEDGERLHVSYYGGSGDDGFSDINGDGLGNLFITGATSSTNLDFAPQGSSYTYVQDTIYGGRDGLIVSFNSLLQLEWTSYFGGIESGGRSDWPTALTIFDDQKMFMVGQVGAPSNFPVVQSSDSSAYYQDTLAKWSDGFIARFGIYQLIGIPVLNDDDNIKIKAFPNPTSDILIIKTKEKVEAIEVYSLTGQLIMQSRHEKQINLKSLKPGLYIIMVNVRNNVHGFKIIKE